MPGWRAQCQSVSETDRQAGQVGRHADRQIHRQTDTQTDRRTDRQTIIHVDEALDIFNHFDEYWRVQIRLDKHLHLRIVMHTDTGVYVHACTHAFMHHFTHTRTRTHTHTHDRTQESTHAHIRSLKQTRSQAKKHARTTRRPGANPRISGRGHVQAEMLTLSIRRRVAGSPLRKLCSKCR